MSNETRNDLIDAYFDAMDEEDLEIVEPALADSFVYESLSGDLEGFEGLREYMEERRSLSNSEHRISRRIHGEEASATEGTVVGDGEDGERVEANFCNVFEFDADERGITRIAVYLNDA
jgi:ketosteroid isomerase-like protein